MTLLDLIIILTPAAFLYIVIYIYIYYNRYNRPFTVSRYKWPTWVYSTVEKYYPDNLNKTAIKNGSKTFISEEQQILIAVLKIDERLEIMHKELIEALRDLKTSTPI